MTIILDAKNGLTSPEVKKVAKTEGVDADAIRRRIAKGSIVIPSNKIHSPNCLGIGKGLRVKINANIGTSREYCNIDEEIKKAQIALDTGAHAIMDLSTGGDLDEIRKRILDVSNVPVGTVPIYQALEKWFPYPRRIGHYGRRN